MHGPFDINLGTSVLKREAKSIEDVAARLRRAGWEETGSVAGGRVRYFEEAGINITAVQGVFGTVIMPSGPVRGAIFGEDAVSLNRTSAIGAGKRQEEDSGGGRQRSGDMRV